MDKNEIAQDQRHLEDPSGASNNDFQAYGMFDANCAPILRQVSTISKWTKMIIHLSLVT
jgi:hypothetical protein